MDLYGGLPQDFPLPCKETQREEGPRNPAGPGYLLNRKLMEPHPTMGVVNKTDLLTPPPSREPKVTQPQGMEKDGLQLGCVRLETPWLGIAGWDPALGQWLQGSGQAAWHRAAALGWHPAG